MKNIILLHGAIGTQNQLENLKQELSKSFNVYSFDFEGHGKTYSENWFSIDLFSKNLSDFIRNNSIQSPNVFGYSMGGYVALNHVFKFENKIENIITYGTKFEWNPEIAAKEIKMLNADKIEGKIPAFANHLNSVHSHNNWKTVLEKTAQMMIELGNDNTLKLSDYSKINTRCLISLGDNDSMVTKEETMAVSNYLPNSNFHLLENFVHPIDKIDHKKLALMISNFINELE